MIACFCNAKNVVACCVVCDRPRQTPDCYPCHCWHDRERCLQDGQSKAEKQKEASGGN